MNQKAMSIIEILRRPAEYSIEQVSRALEEILEVTREYYQTSSQILKAFAAGGEHNGN
jgi:hypothetical protein